MLHAHPLMVDIDVNHWRNLQRLVLESASARPRIVLIHEDGELLKFAHSQRAEVVRDMDRVDDPREVAEQVYRADFVVVFERRAGESVDEYVHRMYATLDEYSDGIVTYPDPASTTLGLRWRVGTSYEDGKAAVDRFVPPDSTVVFGIFEGDALWATLVLGFDADKRVKVITTVDPSEHIVRDVVAWVNREYPPCSLGLFVRTNRRRSANS